MAEHHAGGVEAEPLADRGREVVAEAVRVRWGDSRLEAGPADRAAVAGRRVVEAEPPARPSAGFLGAVVRPPAAAGSAGRAEEVAVRGGQQQRADAAEATQEGLLRAWRRRRKWRAGSNATGYGCTASR